MAFEIAFNSVDLPAFGKPTSPISAINFNSSLIERLSPLAPQYPFVLFPPSPPLATINSESGWSKSPINYKKYYKIVFKITVQEYHLYPHDLSYNKLELVNNISITNEL